MSQDENLSFSKPKTFGIAKYKLFYSAIVIILLVGMIVFYNIPTPMPCFAIVGLYAIYLFLPFTYKLIISDEAISSINLLSTRTLYWNEIAEIGIKNESLFLSNKDGDIKVNVKQQIDGYSDVIRFIKQQRPELWRINDVNTFHQNFAESLFSVLMGFSIFLGGGWAIFKNDLTVDDVLPVLFMLGISVFLAFTGFSKIRKLSLDEDTLVLHHLVWKREFHVTDILSVGLEQQYAKNAVLYPVHIKVRGKKDIVIEKAKEGNPMLVNAIELWMNKYKGKRDERT